MRTVTRQRGEQAPHRKEDGAASGVEQRSGASHATAPLHLHPSCCARRATLGAGRTLAFPPVLVPHVNPDPSDGHADECRNSLCALPSVAGRFSWAARLRFWIHGVDEPPVQPTGRVQPLPRSVALPRDALVLLLLRSPIQILQLL
ncbi:hypothetical protein PSMK_00240 [Phycisphaera mikurensis NBRC 102666]|uniref:Uncharacterized protein n=1 Tax=Phycisphaera mikurensis (strain NBRC 102666 / KCTC 22515 / FYK2301M01) TaxID=1142394 RepID=I0IA95_PHYMF|nr:hypothetical protein PSMK_00240 [Phycisphaera mikurensis NBRC 102666]